MPERISFDPTESNACKFLDASFQDMLTVIFLFDGKVKQIDDMMCDKYQYVSGSTTLHMLFNTSKSGDFAEITFNVPSDSTNIGHPSMSLDNIMQFQMQFSAKKHHIWYQKSNQNIYLDSVAIPDVIIQRSAIFNVMKTEIPKPKSKTLRRLRKILSATNKFICLTE